MRHRLAGLLRADAERPHHLVVLVLDDVAVPDDTGRALANVRLDAGDLPGIGDDRVLEPGLPRLRRPVTTPSGMRGSPASPSSSMTRPSRLTTSNVDLVDVHRVGVGGRVVELPDLGVADARVLGHGIHPQRARPASRRVDRARGPPRPGPRPRRRSASSPIPIFSMSASGRVADRRRQRGDRRQREELRRRRRVGRERGHDPELHDLAGVSGSRPAKSSPGIAAAERLVRADVAEDVAARAGTFVKSTMTSARSARPIRIRLSWSAVMLTGAARKPPSLPICQTSTPGISLKSRIRKRDWQPLRKRNR